MKKDKEWLKRQIIKRSISNVQIMPRTYDRAIQVSEAIKLIDQIDEPEITEEQALNKLAESYPFSADGINGILQAQLAGYSPVSTMKFIQSNEPELPVVPQFVADWYEDHKDNIYYHVSKKIQSAENNNDKSMCLELIEFWLMDFENENIGKILKLKDGYTIEKEKQYRVKVGEKLYFIGYEETVARFVIDDAPGSLEDAYVYNDFKHATNCAKEVGGKVEPVPLPEKATRIELPKTRQVLVKFFDNEEYKTELTEESARELIEFLEANKK